VSRSQFNPAFPIADKSGNATQSFRDYMRQLDAGVQPVLVNAANDAAAAAAGVPISGAYRNGSVLMVRVV
jgi:hypothetical protein